MGKERTKKEAPQMPPNRMFLISGNNTGTGILQNIMDSDGTGLICEAEADTLSTAIGSDHGHWSDTLRKAFDHDRLSYNRRHRPGIPGSEEKLSFRPDFGYAVAGANFHSDGRRRIILPPIILLHVRNQ